LYTDGAPTNDVINNILWVSSMEVRKAWWSNLLFDEKLNVYGVCYILKLSYTYSCIECKCLALSLGALFACDSLVGRIHLRPFILFAALLK